MKIRSLIAAAFVSTLLSAAALAQNIVTPNGSLSFTAGDLLVERMGDGSAALTSNATPIFFDEYNPNGTLIQSVALPTTGNNTSGNYAVTDSGSAASDGFITLSADGQYIAFTGYSANVGTGNLTGNVRTALQTVAGTLSYNGTLSVTNLGTTAYGKNNIRSAYTNGTNVWTVGANGTTGGVWSTNGGTPTQLTTSGNKAINAADGQLYASNGTSILSIGTGLPASGAQSATPLITSVGGGNLTQFFFADLSNTVAGVDTLYIANQASNTTAILKYSLVSGDWVATGSASIGSIDSAGALGLTGLANGSNVTIYGTTANTIFDLTDSSGYDGTLSGTAAALISAGANENFRGIAFAPTSMAVVPEPGAMALLIGLGSLAGAGVLQRKQKPAATNASAN
ncbi:MAG TPA: hypothetical protein VHC95_08385 [Opitutales bacterium]|nr:hypothetical protein [Opitutales bacterium]